MNILASLISGILAAFTPCVIVLIPALIYRFSNEKKPLIEIIKFSVAFLIVYAFSAIFLAKLLSSSFRYGLQLGLGLLFIIMGFLALINKFNPLSFQLIKNTWLFGLVFALIISVNPCVFAYLGILMGTTSNFLLPFSMLAFAIGLVIPAVVIAIFGNQLLSKINKAGKIMHKISNGMNFLLIGIGIYMLYSIKHFGSKDILVTGLMLLLTFIIILRSFYFLEGKKQLLKLKNIILIVALLIILFAVVFHCNAHIKQNNTQDKFSAENNPFNINNFLNKTTNNIKSETPTCGGNVTSCKVCTRCVTIFSIGTLLGFLAIFLTYKFSEKK